MTYTWLCHRCCCEGWWAGASAWLINQSRHIAATLAHKLVVTGTGQLQHSVDNIALLPTCALCGPPPNEMASLSVAHVLVYLTLCVHALRNKARIPLISHDSAAAHAVCVLESGFAFDGGPMRESWWPCSPRRWRLTR